MAHITADRLRELLHYDPATGVFTWRMRTSPKSQIKVGSVAGCLGDGYVHIQVHGVLYLAHRLAWLYVHGVWPVSGLDHEDTVRSHNWIANLRPATESENGQNRRCAHRNNRSGLLGVAWNGRDCTWHAYIKLNGKSKNVGSFGDPHEAHEAYLTAKAQLHPYSTLGLRAN